MRINKLRVKNFRCFESLEMELNSKCNILVGINGAGKSTILDALAIALGGYLAGFDDVKGLSIQQEDAYYKMHIAGSRIEVQEQFPVEVYAEASFENNILYREGFEKISKKEEQKSKERVKVIGWQRELNGKGRRTTYGNVKVIMDYAKKLQSAVRSGDISCVLPLVAYYGTGRLWLQKRNRTPHRKGEKLNRQTGYLDCIAAESNEKQMMQWFEELTYIQLQEGKPVAELEAVKKALCTCYRSSDTSISDVNFVYDVKSRELEIQIYRETPEKNLAEKFPVRMLSDGEKGMISLVADIAYRMALLNPDWMERVLETPGVVLIDEIDLHLHPAWQKKIVSDLMNIFPNVQFIMTTHSPSVLVNVPREDIWILDHSRIYQPHDMTYGRSVEEILRQVMDVDVRPDQVVNLQQAFDAAIDQKDYVAANGYLGRMKKLVGENAAQVIENQIILDTEEQEGEDDLY